MKCNPSSSGNEIKANEEDAEIKFQRGQTESLHSEAKEFNHLLDNGEINKQELEEKLIDPRMTPQELVELLRGEQDGLAFLWAISRPGACTHFFMDNKNSLTDMIAQLKSGESIVRDPKKSESYNEVNLSLHVATGMGVSTAVYSSEFGFLRSGDYSPKRLGFVLKPEYFSKLAGFTERDIDTRDRNNYHIHDDYNLRKILEVEDSIERNIPLKVSMDKKAGEIDPNFGIRNLTIKHGEVAEVPITKSDVEFFFIIESSYLDEAAKIRGDAPNHLNIRFYSPQKDAWLSDEEVEQFAGVGRESKVWERYYNTDNLADWGGI